MIENTDESLLAYAGRFIAPIFVPLGFGRWQAAVASLTGLLAKENIVASFGIFYGSTNTAAGLANDLTGLSAYSFMIFNLLCAPCFAAMGAIRQEMRDKKWTWAAIGYMCVFAYTVCLIVNQLGLFLKGGSFTAATAVAIVLLAGLVYLIARPNPYLKKSCELE